VLLVILAGFVELRLAQCDMAIQTALLLLLSIFRSSRRKRRKQDSGKERDTENLQNMANLDPNGAPPFFDVERKQFVKINIQM